MLADNLILLRGLKGLTQEQAAEIAGVTRQSYSKWEQGETVPDIEKCDRLARHYGGDGWTRFCTTKTEWATRPSPLPLRASTFGAQ